MPGVPSANEIRKYRLALSFPRNFRLPFSLRVVSQQNFLKQTLSGLAIQKDYIKKITNLLTNFFIKPRLYTWLYKNYDLYAEGVRRLTVELKKLKHLTKYTFFQLKFLVRMFNRIKGQANNRLYRLRRMSNREFFLKRRFRRHNMRMYSQDSLIKLLRRSYITNYASRLSLYKRLNSLRGNYSLPQAPHIKRLGGPTLLDDLLLSQVVGKKNITGEVAPLHNPNVIYSKLGRLGGGLFSLPLCNLAKLFQIVPSLVSKYILFSPILLKLLLISLPNIKITSLLSGWAEVKAGFFTNLAPVSIFTKNIRLKMLTLFGDNRYRKLSAFWYNATLVRFIQFIFGLNVPSYFFLSVR